MGQLDHSYHSYMKAQLPTKPLLQSFLGKVNLVKLVQSDLAIPSVAGSVQLYILDRTQESNHI